MNELEAEIQAFLASKRIAVVGASSHAQDFSCAILERLRETGAEVLAINPKLAADPEAGRYPRLEDVPGRIDAAFLATSPEVSEQVVRECHELGIDKVWMHQNIGRGSTSERAVAFCKEHGISVIDRGCPMMFVEPVDWFHKTFRFCKGMHAVPQPSH